MIKCFVNFAHGVLKIYEAENSIFVLYVCMYFQYGNVNLYAFFVEMNAKQTALFKA